MGWVMDKLSHLHKSVWNVVTNPYSYLNLTAIEVRAWMDNYISFETMAWIPKHS